MDQRTLEAALFDLPLNAIRYFPSLDSTNDEAARWVAQGAADLALVVADEQTAGRGRAGRRWYTPAGAALAFSLILRTPQVVPGVLTRLTALGTLAVHGALRGRYGLPAQIKWPNDVVIQGRKVAGVLAEAHWLGDRLEAVILGIGINVAPDSVSDTALPPAERRFPVTCVESALGGPVERVEVLHAVLAELIHWRPRLVSLIFLQAWEASLAFLGEWVRVSPGEGFNGGSPLNSLGRPSQRVWEGQIAGLAPDGALRLRTRSGEIVTAQVGEIRLHPLDEVVKA